ncbi:hypothetical protein [Nonomuraea recticatena]|uniref:Uncharacterized protein n=1 Tax=Nonomuraea recticatena TaxID=46178 RepID=A0ABP6F9U8_9ACTN
MVAPKYQDIGGTNVVLLSSDDGGALVRVITGADRSASRWRTTGPS